MLLRKLLKTRIAEKAAPPLTAKAKDDSAWKEIGLAAPARRALVNAKIFQLSDLARRGEAEIAALHGMGPNALTTLRAALKQKRLAFRK